MISDFLFHTFWIVTGVFANLLALTMLFFLFAFIVIFIKNGFKKED